MQSILTKQQRKAITKEYTRNGVQYKMMVQLRYDDECGNGHNTFSVTADIRRKDSRGRWADYLSGCCHDEIIEQMPQLKEAIKWHLVSSDGPLHYIANTLYLAGDRDCYGLKKGERRQIKNSTTGKPCWKLEENLSLEKYVDSDTRPRDTVVLTYLPLERIGYGKEPDLQGARNTAIWPEATLEQLQDKEALEARLPSLLAELKKMVESFGFIY